MTTRNIVPRATNEGGVGTTSKKWANIWATLVNALTLTAQSTGFTIAGGTTSKTLTVDETATLSAKANLASSISDGDTTHAPDGNSVFDALALKANLISPSFTTPALGTPSSGTLTNCTGLPQAGVTGLTTTDSPVFGTVKLSGLTDGYLPKHTSDAVGLVNSPIYTDGTNVGIGTSSPVKKIDINGVLTLTDGSRTRPAGICTESYSTLINIGINEGSGNRFGTYDPAYQGGILRIDSRVASGTPLFQFMGRAEGVSSDISPLLSVLATGYTGVATTTPASKLSVLGNLSVGATYANIAAPASGAIVEGNVGIGTSSPTNILSFGGNAARKIWMERHATADTAGNSLTIQGGSATASATNKAGGQLILVPGLSTGTGESGVTVQGCLAGSTGTTDGTLQDMMKILGNKLGFYNTTPVAKAAHIADATDAATAITRINAILTVLENLGLVATS